MVVSDLGLTAFSGDDGLHALARSLGTAAPLAGVEMRLDRAQQRSAGDQDDRRRRARRFRSRPVSRDRRRGARADRRRARRRLRFSQPDAAARSTSPTAALRAATRRSALDAFLYTERGVYRSGETVFVAALLRDAKGVAKPGVPLTLVVKRPDGVEYKRVERRRSGPRRARARGAAGRRRARRAHGRSTPSPIRRRRRSAMPNSCSRTMCPSGSTSR